MKLHTLALCSAFTLLLSAPITSIAGSDFDKAAKDATAAIDKAKAANYEWRDSRKILKKAAKAEKAGKHDKAMKLAKKAKQQGIIAVAQAKQQKNAGPH
jgi:hypothetical protein